MGEKSRCCVAQVKGGRHEVPETAPQQAFEMLQVFALGRVLMTLVGFIEYYSQLLAAVDIGCPVLVGQPRLLLKMS